jgi:Tfp pilus assembly protein PilV
MRNARLRSRRSGFTILEILIAIVILVLGISGIIALFPTAIEAGNQTVQDSYAAAITQSVVDAVAVGLTESRYRTTDQQQHTWTYFIFDHDGVWDPMSPTPQNYDSMYQVSGNQFPVSDADWCILIPQGPDQNADPNKEPTFNYPAVRQCDNLGGGPTYIDSRYQNQLPAILNSPGAYDDWDQRFFRATYKGERMVYVRRVYHLGRYRRYQEKTGFPSPPTAPGPIRDEFLGPNMVANSTDPSTRPIVDPYPQYSFALSIRRAKVDNHNLAGQAIPDGLITAQDTFSSTLCEVRIMIFRNFNSDTNLHSSMAQNPSIPIPRTNCPIREFVTLMSL